MLFSGFMMLMGLSLLSVALGIILGVYVEVFNVSNTQISILTAITHCASGLSGRQRKEVKNLVTFLDSEL